LIHYHCILKNASGLILKDFSTPFMCTLCTCDCNNRIATKMACLTQHDIASNFLRVFKKLNVLPCPQTSYPYTKT
jgi:hypothetical protein